MLGIDLRKRVEKLEQMIKDNTFDRAREIVSKPPLFTPENQQPVFAPPLIDYIKQSLQEGINEEEIKNQLLAKGWQISDIKKAFSSLIPKESPTTPHQFPKEETTTSEIVQPSFFTKITNWFKEDWLLKLGAIILLIGFAWLATYAFAHNWIGPKGRITLGITAGVLFIILGWWRIKTYLTQGGTFLVLGSTTILLTIFAARAVYHFFTPASALIVMFLSTTFVALASVKYNNRILALLSLALASVAPLLIKAPATDHIWLFSYLLVVIIGTMWIVALTKQRELTLASLIIVAIYSTPHFVSPSSFPLVDLQKLLLFAYAFAAVFFLTNTTGILKLDHKKIAPDLITAGGNGCLLLAWIMTAAKEEWKSLIIISWMIVFSVGAFLIFRIIQRKEPFYIYAAVGVVMLAAATAIEAQGATLTIAYTIEATLITLLTYIILKDIKITQITSLLLLAPIALSGRSIISESWEKGIMHKDFFALLLLGLVLLGLYKFFLHCLQKSSEPTIQHSNSAVFLFFGSLYFYILLWLSLHAELKNDNIAVMIALLIYTIMGVFTYFYGLRKERKEIRVYGAILIAFVVGRLLLVDTRQMELSKRILTFFLIGALLASTAFLGKKTKNILDSSN